MPSIQHSDDLLAAAQRGDKRALELLLAHHRQIVFRYGLRVCRTSEDAEDAVQETLWSVTRSIAAFRRASALTTWLFTIVRNACHRTNSKRVHDRDLADLLPTIPDPGQPLEQQLALQQVEGIIARALAAIDPVNREVVLLRDIEGMTAPEAAHRLSITVAALKSRLHRGREQLRLELAEERLNFSDAWSDR